MCLIFIRRFMDFVQTLRQEETKLHRKLTTVLMAALNGGAKTAAFSGACQ
jgi:hypothetical protein